MLSTNDRINSFALAKSSGGMERLTSRRTAIDRPSAAKSEVTNKRNRKKRKNLFIRRHLCFQYFTTGSAKRYSGRHRIRDVKTGWLQNKPSGKRRRTIAGNRLNPSAADSSLLLKNQYNPERPAFLADALGQEEVFLQNAGPNEVKK